MTRDSCMQWTASSICCQYMQTKLSLTPIRCLCSRCAKSISPASMTMCIRFCSSLCSASTISMMCLLSPCSLKSRISSISLRTASRSAGSASNLTVLSARIRPSGESTRKTCEVPPRPIIPSLE